MKIQSHETDLIGKWRVSGSVVEKDQTSRRIETLVRDHLRLLGSDSSGWDTLYVDTADGRLWELTYPQSDVEGGGPPRLTCVERNQVVTKYKHLLDVG